MTVSHLALVISSSPTIYISILMTSRPFDRLVVIVRYLESTVWKQCSTKTRFVRTGCPSIQLLSSPPNVKLWATLVVVLGFSRFPKKWTVPEEGRCLLSKHESVSERQHQRSVNLFLYFVSAEKKTFRARSFLLDSPQVKNNILVIYPSACRCLLFYTMYGLGPNLESFPRN